MRIEYTAATGDCYESSVHAFMDHKWTEYGLPLGRSGWTLVHTMCRGGGPIEGVRFGHAFLFNREMGLVLDLANSRGGLVPSHRYFRLGDVDPDLYPFHEYTYSEMVAELVAHETYGPWGKVDEEITKIESESMEAAGLVKNPK